MDTMNGNFWLGFPRAGYADSMPEKRPPWGAFWQGFLSYELHREDVCTFFGLRKA